MNSSNDMTDKRFPINKQSSHLMRQLINHYLDRQKVVASAMLDVHPAPLTLNGQTRILGVEIAPYFEVYRQKSTTPQSGIWRDKWQFYWHGLGCRLTHTETKEPIEWDGPHLHVFDELWFFTHLEWRVNQRTPSSDRKRHMKWLVSIFNHMKDSGQIMQTHPQGLEMVK